MSWDAEGTTGGEHDLATQTERGYLDIGTALAKLGGTFDDIANLTAYVVDWTRDRMRELAAGIARAVAKPGTTATSPATLLGVAALDIPTT